MIEIGLVKAGEGMAAGVKVDMPTAPFLLISTGKGYVNCGYLAMEVSEKKGDMAAIVNNVNNFEDVLKAKIIQVSSEAGKRGIKIGDTGKEALEKMF